jgi:TM2 domain-containing membrane protein YozV
MRIRSKFFTFIFSLVPGAGQMYLGFMKQGVTLMFMFFFTIFLVDYFRISFIIALLPVVWCYSFFDTFNKASLPPEKLEELEDRSMLEELLRDGFNKIPRKNIWLGVILVVFGGLLLVDNVVLPELRRMNLINLYAARDYLRTVIASAIIILVGIRLITGKKVNSQ